MMTDFPMFTVVLSIPRWGSLGVRTDSATGDAPTDGAGPEPVGTGGFTASSRFHMGNLHYLK
jgi:hypothetical protein